jgi:hypothetical protein
LKFTINRVSAAIKPKKFAKGTLSYIDILKNKSMNGIRTPPPPRPPALARNVIDIRATTPIISVIVGGN